MGAGSPGGRFGAVWGRAVHSCFAGREGTLGVDGEVTSAMLGGDFATARMVLGALLSHSTGEGTYAGEGEGEVESALTGLYPYGRFALNERVSLWGVAGYGTGSLTLAPAGPAGDADRPAPREWGPWGLRGVAREVPVGGGLEVRITSDAMGVRTTSERTTGLAGATADVTRLRLGLEGSWSGIEMGRAGTLAPTGELGVRHDGGDAETGFGVDVGASLAWSNQAHELSGELSARGLLHTRRTDFASAGWQARLPTTRVPTRAAGSRSVCPRATAHRRPEDQLRSSDVTLSNDWGQAPKSRARSSSSGSGYGHGVLGARFTATPEAGLGLSGTHREYRIGWSLALDRSQPVSLELGLEATRRKAQDGEGEATNALALRGAMHW